MDPLKDWIFVIGLINFFQIIMINDWLQEAVDSDLLQRPDNPGVELLDQRDGACQKVQGGTFQVLLNIYINYLQHKM